MTKISTKAISVVLIALGLALMAVSAGYYGYARMAEARLGQLTRNLGISGAGSEYFSRALSEGGMGQNAATTELVPGPATLSSEVALPAGETSASQEVGKTASDLPFESPKVPSLVGSAPRKNPVPALGPFLRVFPIYIRPEPAIRIVIPSIEVDSKVVELGTTYDEKGELVWETPKNAVGHLGGTANLGEVGNVSMAGHINSPTRGEGNVFRRLPEVQPGDEVTIYTFGAKYSYVVTETKVVLPEETSVILPTPEPILTLITCVPDWVWSHRLIVVARPVAVEQSR